jgi:outer membrane immunogenic protein
MKRFLLTSVAAIACAGGSALAADMAVKAPVYAPFSWQGCYAGFNGGGAWTSTTYNVSGNLPGFAPFFATGATPSSYSANTSGGIVGGQAGCNLQSGQLVYGLEADADWSHNKPSDRINTATIFGPASGYVRTDLQSLATIRARLGWAFDHLLLYGTGGIALGNTNDFYTYNLPAFGQNFQNTWSTNRTGYAAGAGVEYALGYNLSAKLEGIWYHLDGTSYQAGNLNAAGGVPPNAVHVIAANADSGWMLKVGLNYKVW